VGPVDQLAEGLHEFVEGHRQHRGFTADQVRRAGSELIGLAAERGAQAAPNPVPLDRATGAAAHGIRDAGRSGRRAVDHADAERTAAHCLGSGEGLKCSTVADRLRQAPSRLRPRARRDFSTARPPRVRIRMRKPWVLLRFRLLG
jgi:hypothetical protein